MASGPTGVDLEYPSRGAAYAPRRVVERWGVFHDAHNQAIVVDEQEVERNTRVVHPELVIVAKAQVEEHPSILGHALAKHQAPRSIVLRADEIRIDGHRADVGKPQVHLRQAGLPRLRVRRAARGGPRGHRGRRLGRRELETATGRRSVQSWRWSFRGRRSPRRGIDHGYREARRSRADEVFLRGSLAPKPKSDQQGEIDRAHGWGP